MSMICIFCGNQTKEKYDTTVLCEECQKNKTLHRVKIKYKKQNVACPLNCVKAEPCLRCNKYWNKCSIYEKSLK